MKSLFKRTLATATGSVLALSQLVSVANVVNISAEDSTLPPVDKSYVLSVTFDKEDPLAAGQTSGWADDVESKFLELQDHTYSYSSQKVKNALARELKRRRVWQSTFPLRTLMHSSARSLRRSPARPAQTVLSALSSRSTKSAISSAILRRIFTPKPV